MIPMIDIESGSSELSFLLDTHIWLWVLNGDSEIKNNVKEKIKQASLKGKICISAISIWEIARLSEKGLIRTKIPFKSWIKKALSHPRIEVMPLANDILLNSCLLPNFREYQLDAADRMIITTAAKEKLTIITADSNVIEYAMTNKIKFLRN